MKRKVMIEFVEAEGSEPGCPFGSPAHWRVWTENPGEHYFVQDVECFMHREDAMKYAEELCR